MHTLLFLVISFFLSTPLYAADSSLTFQELNKFTSSIGATDDYFGISVAISRDTVVVGSYGEYATIFERNPTTGLFEKKAILTASDAAAYKYFGGDVSISGGTVVVGAYHDDCAPNSPCGAAYLFEKPVSGWANMTETAKLTASDIAYMDCFGWEVAISGNAVVVGSVHDTCADGRLNCGSAYLFEKPVSGWVNMTETAKLTAFDDDSYMFFGYSVAISGDTVVVGTPYDNSDTYSGSAYLFQKPISGWVNATQTSKLVLSDAKPNTLFGCSVAVSGNTAVVGAIMAENNAGIHTGSAYIFEKQITGWGAHVSETAKLTASDGAAEDFFGSVAINDNLVIVGAYEEEEGGEDSGSAYIFTKPTTGWFSTSENAKLIASDSAPGEQFGYSIAISGYTLVIGARNGTDTGRYSGSAYVFKGNPLQKTFPWPMFMPAVTGKN
ncbi:MAG: FG-GAP repeat protein [Proteobacteria bacterium]|nr:FG-GAP repeat protein [Pseudomonadota bacterium]MBU1061011.1 FG-GAP repeat protein [Pseudomonadota bacterium]